ncbi:unnamed protein product, partial [Porites lobata]
LSPAQGGTGIPDLKRESLEQFNASLDITAPHVNSIGTQSSTIPARELMEERKCEINAKRRAAAKVMDVEMGTFTPLVFGTNGGMGLDCQDFLRTLANKLSTKNDISWLRIQLSFAILKTVHRCVRGSRYPFKSREVSKDFTFAVADLHPHS